MLVSYAQNLEDVLLMRFFGFKNHGTYIDVGACWPDNGSVTKAFYNVGWRGINIEPHPEPFAELRAARAGDINLNVALSRDGRRIELFEGPSAGETSHERRSRSAGFLVDSWTLRRVCEKYPGGDVDFLKIDVEGMELEVLEGADFTHFRPKVIVCEVTKPWTTTLSDGARAIDDHLSEAGYGKVYFDGLNNFYVDRLRGDLSTANWLPPNVTDGYLTAREADLSTRLADQGVAIETLEREHATREADLSTRLADQGVAIETLEREHATREADLSTRLADQGVGIETLEREHATREADLSTRLADQGVAIETLEREHARREADLSTRLASSQQEFGRLNQAIHEQNEWGRAAVAHVEILTSQLSAMHQSRSWRLTQPLRFLSRIASSLAEHTHRVPRAVARRSETLLRKRAPRLHRRIAVSRFARRLYFAFARRTDIALAPLVRSHVTPKPVVGPAGSPTLSSLTSSMRRWSPGRRLDG